MDRRRCRNRRALSDELGSSARPGTSLAHAFSLAILCLACAPPVSSEPAPPLAATGGRPPGPGSGGAGAGGATDAGGSAGGAEIGIHDAGPADAVATGGAPGNHQAIDAPPAGTDSGASRGTGGGGGAAGGKGGTGDGGGLSGNDPLFAAARCTSNAMWTTGNSQTMAPGQACPDCHPNFLLAGTLYPSGHEPNNCNGVDGLANNVTVIVTDATGRQLTLYPNTVGNFYTSIAITPPYSAKVVAGGKERTMAVTQTIGACNSCHTQAGANGAPGRITLPY